MSGEQEKYVGVNRLKALDRECNIHTSVGNPLETVKDFERRLLAMAERGILIEGEFNGVNFIVTVVEHFREELERGIHEIAELLHTESKINFNYLHGYVVDSRKVHQTFII